MEPVWRYENEEHSTVTSASADTRRGGFIQFILASLSLLMVTDFNSRRPLTAEKMAKPGSESGREKERDSKWTTSDEVGSSFRSEGVGGGGGVRMVKREEEEDEEDVNLSTAMSEDV